MSALTFVSTPWLRAIHDVLLRARVGLGWRVSIAQEIWRREVLEQALEEAREESWGV